MQKDSEVVVYYKGERPDTIYQVYNKPPIGETPYVEIAGYWLPETDGTPNPKYHYVENQHRRPMLMDKDWLINKIIPDSKAVKCFDTLQEFQNDQFLNAI